MQGALQGKSSTMSPPQPRRVLRHVHSSRHVHGVSAVIALCRQPVVVSVSGVFSTSPASSGAAAYRPAGWYIPAAHLGTVLRGDHICDDVDIGDSG
jgi:hypothetical protein